MKGRPVPTYQYSCTECGEQLEVVQKFTDDALTTCPTCGGPLRKVFSAVGVVFKGSGFYRTDSRASSGANGSKTGSRADGRAGSGADSGAGSGADSVAASKSDPKPESTSGSKPAEKSAAGAGKSSGQSSGKSSGQGSAA